MKKNIFFIMILGISFYLNAQTVERLIITSQMDDLNFQVSNDPYYENCDGGSNPSPSEFYVDELKNNIVISNNSLHKNFIIHEHDIYETDYEYHQQYSGFYKFPDFIIAENNSLIINDNKNNYYYMSAYSGLSFILKKEKIYYLFGVNKNGSPVGISTAGQKFSSKEVYDFLKLNFPEEYEESCKTAIELGLELQFLASEKLIWKKTYFDTPKTIKSFWKKDKWLFPVLDNPLLYDLNGYAYQFYYSHGVNETCFVCVNSSGNWEFNPINFDSYSSILSKNKCSHECRGYWFVSFAGNAYFVLTDSDSRETEVFRIRNTWDSTNLYALAINGYTEDFYGDYVNEVLPKMSKADLRLLRNTVFALYGVHFKSEDLAKYFDKQVWYTDEGKSSGEISLPENRQKLVEMILELEK